MLLAHPPAHEPKMGLRALPICWAELLQRRGYDPMASRGANRKVQPRRLRAMAVRVTPSRRYCNFLPALILAPS